MTCVRRLIAVPATIIIVAVAVSHGIRSHGIAHPDPTTAASNPSAYCQAIGSVDVNRPAFKAAGPACRAQALKTAGG